MDRDEGFSAGNVSFFIALLATALALGGALAHALELPNKIGLSQQDYFTVQQIYAGWNRLGFLLAVQFIGMLAVIVTYRNVRQILLPALLALGFLIAAQLIFWTFTFPTNTATANWTQQPADWELLRAQWEYSHLAGAAFQTLAMVSLIVAVLRR